MTIWIALLRGINVGGNNILPMKELRTLLGELGFADVSTYIQSGNCVFRSDAGEPSALAEAISGKIEQAFRFKPDTLVLPLQDFQKAVSGNPFPEGVEDPKSLHIFFLAKRPDSPDVAALEALRTPSERYHLSASAFYLHAPEGVGRSKLASRAESLLGVSATARNLRSAMKLADMAARLDGGHDA